MRWDDFRRSDNIDDRRDGGGGDDGGGGGFGLPIGGGGLGIGTIVILTLVGWAVGIDPRTLIDVASNFDRPAMEQTQQRAPSRNPGNARPGTPTDEMGNFVAAVVGEIDDRWKEIFTEQNARYVGARVVLFRGQNAEQCGRAQAAMGPFYCPPNRQIFLDTAFFDEIEKRFRGCSGKACKFTQAYIIAHEAGHHVQNQFGILSRAQQIQASARSKADANRVQVRVELQADCFAGVWANREKQKRDFLDAGDVDAALQTAAAIGDDTLQRQSQGRVVPDAFTHGSAEQRKRWFLTGYNSGKVADCNTFASQQL